MENLFFNIFGNIFFSVKFTIKYLQTLLSTASLPFKRSIFIGQQTHAVRTRVEFIHTTFKRLQNSGKILKRDEKGYVILFK